MNYSNWPCLEFERQFYKEIAQGGYSYLVPATKLGQGQILTAENARREAAKGLLNADATLLANTRKDQKDSLLSQIASAKSLYESADGKDAKEREASKQRFAQILTALNAQTFLEEEPEATDADGDYFVARNRKNDVLHKAWTAALYIPFVGSPPVEQMYKYFPVYVLAETQDFFAESLSAPEKQSSETPVSSTDSNGLTPKKSETESV